MTGNMDNLAFHIMLERYAKRPKSLGENPVRAIR